LALHLIKSPLEDVERLSQALINARVRVRFCDRCFNLSDDELCGICRDTRRDSSIVCVVEESRDIVAIEKTGEFRGRYHVLLGLIDPLQGIGPDQLKVRELVARIKPEGISEIIVCTNNNTEGDVTAMYLSRALSPLGITVTRLASGLPVGGDLEFADEVTLGRALGHRHVIDP
jgi:recombination protein RecR